MEETAPCHNGAAQSKSMSWVISEAGLLDFTDPKGFFDLGHFKSLGPEELKTCSESARLEAVSVEEILAPCASGT